jgi:hypothetical protein
MASGHLEARRADIITIGTLPNNVLDNSSVTKQGNNFTIPLSQVGGNITQLQTDTTTLSNQLNASTTSLNIQINVGTNTLRSQFITKSQRPFDLLIGTAGMPGVDYTIVKSSDLIPPMQALGAWGIFGSLPLGTTAHGRMIFVGGPFDFNGSTKPSGITWEMQGSSSVFQPSISDTTGTYITVYGDGITPDLVNWKVDGSSQLGYTGEKIVLSSNVIINNLSFTNFNSVCRSAALQNNLLYINYATNVVVNDLSMFNFSGRIETLNNGDGATIYVFSSTGVYFNRPHLGYWTKQSASNASVWGFAKSSEWHIRDGLFENAYQDFININGGNVKWDISRNIFHNNGAVNFGVINGFAQQFGGSSTGTITGNTFIFFGVHHIDVNIPYVFYPL